jgi:hypothetical protein
MLSAGVFAVVLGVLVVFDERVRGRFTDLVAGGTSGAAWSEFGGAIMSAIQYQSLENAPLLVFATVGATLFLFMVKS